jgi:hypothetical protein
MFGRFTAVCVEGIKLARGRDQWHVVLNSVVNLRVLTPRSE